MAAGRVCTGFSKPYVVQVQDGTNAYSTSGGRLLARGVSVSIDVDSSDDNEFYGDNGCAERAGNVFSAGTLTLVVDGLLEMPERFLSGLARKEDGWVCYDDRQKSDFYVSVGFIARYQKEGTSVYVPIILFKCKFDPISTSASTQEENIDFQTQELTAKIYKIKAANGNGRWKYVGEECATEAEAENMIKDKFHIT